MQKPTITILQQAAVRTGQTVRYEQLARIDAGGSNVRMRITVKADPYDFQCSGVAELWNENELGWKPVASLMPTEVQAHKHPLGPGRAIFFEQDVKALTIKVLLALGLAEPADEPVATLVVTVEGGTIQAISADRKVRVLVIDYDTQGEFGTVPLIDRDDNGKAGDPASVSDAFISDFDVGLRPELVAARVADIDCIEEAR